jgi:Cu-Zn family superoxide dismutase
MKKSPWIIAVAVVCALGCSSAAFAQNQKTKADAHDAHALKEEVHLPTAGVAVVHPFSESEVQGVVLFDQKSNGLHIHGKIMGLTPGKHGFHIHQFGDIRDPKGESAGGHFDPAGHKHGAPGEDEHHAGDLGNITANQDGVANVDINAPWLKLHFIVGRSLVVHGGADDLKSQPSGAAGPRVGVGVIGIAKPAEQGAKK